jgi:hypothetical protein
MGSDVRLTFRGPGRLPPLEVEISRELQRALGLEAEAEQFALESWRSMPLRQRIRLTLTGRKPQFFADALHTFEEAVKAAPENLRIRMERAVDLAVRELFRSAADEVQDQADRALGEDFKRRFLR